MPTILMSLLPIRPQFHLSVQVVHPAIPVLVMLPSPICASHVPSRVSPSTHATPSLFPQLYNFISSFVCFSRPNEPLDLTVEWVAK